MAKDKIDIYAKQVGKNVQYIEIPYFNETDILLAQKMRYKKVEEVPQVKKGIQSVTQIGVTDLIDPFKRKVAQLLEDTAWVVVLLDAVQKENSSPTIQKAQ